MRFLKQFLYGLFYLIVLVIVVSGAYYFLKPSASCTDNKLNQNEEQIDCGGSCLPCTLKNKQNLNVAALEIFDSGNNTLTTIGEIHNPNTQLGVEKFAYTIHLYDRGGKVIFSKTGESFIYPGKNRTIIEPGLNVSPVEADHGDLALGEVNWQMADKFPSIPEGRVTTKNLSIQLLKNEFLVNGDLINNNSFKLGKILVKAILFDNDDVKQGASLTTLENLEAFGNKTFIIHIPMAKTAISKIISSKTKILIEIPR